MQTFVNLIAGLVALIAAAALSQFGVDLQIPSSPDREVHRTADCPDAAAASSVAKDTRRDC